MPHMVLLAAAVFTAVGCVATAGSGVAAGPDSVHTAAVVPATEDTRDHCKTVDRMVAADEWAGQLAEDYLRNEVRYAHAYAQALEDAADAKEALAHAITAGPRQWLETAAQVERYVAATVLMRAGGTISESEYVDRLDRAGERLDPFDEHTVANDLAAILDECDP